MVVVGDTISVAPVMLPGVQTYTGLSIPEDVAVKVAELPLQINWLAPASTLAIVSVCEAVPVQVPVVPVTVYVVVEVGDTLIAAVVAPVFHK